MKKILLATTLIIATGLSGALFAAPDAADRPARGMERMAKELSLTAEQQEQIDQIREEQRAQMKTLREQGKARFDEVLTAEQREKMQTLHEERRERMENGRRHHDDRPCDKAPRDAAE
ncbi:MAG: Spy/CpxP family protein refolding chaperone [Halopseudomonas sp.]|uniref:Spy/CpxP family protein refolding chaperone n=1 Tax=Halopseudomonas sp. TaxID=2901191 RepID=UPI0030022C84